MYVCIHTTGASGLVDIWRCWGRGVPRKGMEAPHSFPHILPYPFIISRWFNTHAQGDIMARATSWQWGNKSAIRLEETSKRGAWNSEGELLPHTSPGHSTWTCFLQYHTQWEEKDGALVPGPPVTGHYNTVKQLWEVDSPLNHLKVLLGFRFLKHKQLS